MSPRVSVFFSRTAVFGICFLGDMVTAVEFDQTGDYLAVGDKAGRIWLFEAHLNKVYISFSLLFGSAFKLGT